jgi:signal transduction histidine kinase
MPMSITSTSWLSAYDMLNDGVSLLDAEGTLLRCNKAMADLLDRPQADLIGRRCFELVECGSHRIENCPAACSLCVDTTRRLAHRVGDRQLEISVQRLFDGSGELSGFLHFMSDATSRASVVDEPLTPAHVENLQGLGMMTGIIAHDFNNMLCGIAGHADLASSQTEEKSPAKDHLKQVQLMTERAMELTRELLAYARDQQPSNEKVNLSMLVNEMTQLLSVRVPQNVEVVKDLNGDLPMIDVCPTQIRQVILNLVVNAAEAVGDGRGEIFVSVRSMECDEALLAESRADTRLIPGIYVCLEVRDTGHGMDEQTLAHAFTPFVSNKVAGQGLGLPGVLRVVQHHGGGLCISSKPGKGTCVQLLFPAKNGRPFRM